jgi:hypothetical protein
MAGDVPGLASPGGVIVVVVASLQAWEYPAREPAG